uniref:MORN repeat protein n=1 Tax=viral metagenome TaxID=1070528 RepID=A0A6C0ERS7_9ZZZZ
MCKKLIQLLYNLFDINRQTGTSYKMKSVFEFVFYVIMAMIFYYNFYGYENKNKISQIKNYVEEIEKFKNHLFKYEIAKEQFNINCNQTLYSIGTMKCGMINYQGDLIYGYKNGCGTLYYPNGHSYEGLWENDTENGFGMYIDNRDNVLVSGNKKNGKYHGLVKFHIDVVSNNNTIQNFHCLFSHGICSDCYVEYNKTIRHVMNKDVLNLCTF